jgi:hypothetical protein
MIGDLRTASRHTCVDTTADEQYQFIAVRDLLDAEAAGSVRFKRPCERRVAGVSRETASGGPSPAQLTELRLLYT